MQKQNNYKPAIYDIALVNLPYQGEFSLYGPHPCVIYNRIGCNFRIVPITNYKEKLYWCEYPLEKGRCNLNKRSKLKLDQEKNVSIEQIICKIGIADNEIKKAIKEYLNRIANSIEI